MSGNLGPQASTKGETTSKPTSKTGYDRLDINKLYKGKAAEPVAKTVTQKHGMQTLGKAPPARRAGASLVKPETTSNDNSNSSVPPQQQQHQTPSSNLGQPIPPQHPKWSNTSHPPGPPSPLNVPNVNSTGQQPMHDKNWSGGPDVGGNYQSQRFAQEFPSLDAGSEPTRGSLVNSNQQPPPGSGLQTSSKSHDNQYGPGPILRPQTEGNWNQGGGRGMTRPPGPPGPNALVREPGPERPNLGGPTPPPMSLGQGGPAPPPLGAYPMQYRGMPPFMYPNSGPPGPGYYPPPGQGMRYGMPVPPGAPPPPGPRDDGHRDSNRNRGPPPPLRPTQQFAVKPIIRQEDMRRMDDIDQEGTWSSVRDDVDYNKRISFSDDESEERRDSKRLSERKSEKDRPDIERIDRKPVRILERQPSTNERELREPQPRDQDQRYDHANKEHSGYDQDNEEDWNKRRPNAPYDIKDRSVRRGRDPREDDWRSNNRFEEDGRNKKGPPGPGSGPNVRVDTNRGPPDFANKQYSNLPPRLLRQQQQQNIQSSFAGNQRKTPSPVSAQLSGKDREKDFQRDRDWDRERERTQPTTQYRILERNRGDSESSNTSIRDKRIGNNDFDSRSYVKEQNSRTNSDSQRDKNKEIESPKDKTESGENRNDTKRSEDSKASFRSKSGFTSSWADEVDEDEFEDVRKPIREPLIQATKPEMIKTEERTVPKRVYIQQRKVENMTTHKSEPQQEQKQLSETPKPDKPAERPRSTAWGEREGRDKSRNDTENSSQLTEVSDVPKITEREIILSEKAQQLIHHNREDHPSEHFEKNQEDERYTNKDFDKKENKDRMERHEQEKSRDRFGHHKMDPRQQDRDRGNNFNRDNRQQRPGGRWSSNEFRRDTRTPEREFNASSGRSSATDNSSASFASSNKAPVENETTTRVIAADKSRSADSLKEGSPVLEKDVCDGVNKEKLDMDRDENRHKDMDRRGSSRNINDEGDSDGRGNYKGGRSRETRERVGHAVYQPRGGWGRQDTRGKGRGGGSGRDHYDNRPRRNDFDRDQDRLSNRDDREAEISKEKPTEEDPSLNYEVRKESIVEDDNFKKDRETGAGEPNKKSSKSPVTSKRNMRGGNRLQGYGPPSDKNPFSSASSNKDDDTNREKQTEQNNKVNPAAPTGPVPLMELGDISPPNMPSRPRHHGGRGRGSSGGMPPRMQEPYPFRGGNKRGRGDAKPLMSITSNDLERNEWESGSESGEDDSKKSQSGGLKGKKEGNKASGNEKYRQNQNIIRITSTKDKTNIAVTSNNAELSNCANNQDPVNNNKGKGALGRSGTSNSDLDSYSSAIGGDVPQPGSTSDNSENIDGDGYQSQIQNKKNVQGKDKSNFNSNKNMRNDKAAIKDRKVKNPPYEARPSTTKDIPPRFQKQQQGNQTQYSSKTSDGSNTSTKEPQGQTNAWEKPVSTSSATKSDQNSQSVTQSIQALSIDNKDSMELKNSVTVMAGVHASGTNSSAIMDNSGGPVKTMIFENRNYKSISNASKAPGSSTKLGDSKSESLTSGLDLSKDMPLTFGKGVGEDSSDIDFDFEQSTTQPQTTQSVSSHHSSSKPTPIGQPSRSYSSHQPSPISPLAADLNEKIQSVKRVWDAPSMLTSVAEQVGVCGSEDNSFHGGFGNDSFKAPESSNRDFSSSLQQSQSGYAPGSSPALSAISKPDSSTSPNSTSMRQVKPQQQSSMDNQSHGGMSSSPFAYSMPQQHQTNAFGGMSAVPSPPAVMYGTSQALHGGHHTGVYQAFPHEASQVMNTTGRSQYGQYSNPQAAAGSGPYGLSASIFMPSIDTGYQPMSSFQHQQQHSQSGPQGQAPNQNNRISPGPMTTSGGGNAGGVMMNSSGMKTQQGTGAHPNMSHQHQHQVISGTHSQQGYSHNQMSHHHHQHHQHAVGPVGPSKAQTYTQGGITTQSQPQLFIPFDPNQQSVMNFGQNYISSGIRSAPPQGGPPPSATPPVQALQPSSSYYSGNTGNQVYHGSNQPGGNLQQLHVAVAPNPQALQNLQTATQQLGLQFQSPLNIQQYNQQAATTVSALNLGGQLMRPGPPGHSHSYMKQPGLELVQQSQQQQMKSHESMMNQAWNTQGYSLNQGFHGGNKPGGNTNSGNNIGSQRKGNHQMGNMGNMGGMKYMSNTGGGYPGQKGGRFSAPGPIQRPVSTSPSTGPPGSIIASIPSGIPHSGPIGVGPGGVLKPNMTNDNANKHMNQNNSGMEEGLLDKFMTESAVHRSIPVSHDPSKIIMGSRLIEDHSKDHNGAENSSLKNPNLTIAPANNSPISTSEK